MGKVTIYKGDALQAICDVLCHQVNLYGNMSGGIALQIANLYPSVLMDYQAYSPKGLGQVCFSKTYRYTVANCFSQDGFRTDYKALEECLDNVVTYLKNNNLHVVAIPYNYGCGISTGNWDKVFEIFKTKLKDYELKVYKL